MWIGIISLFPKMFNAITNYGITSKAIKNGFLTIKYWNPRDFTKDKNKIIDDKPYGGGAGMLMLFKPLKKAIRTAKNKIGSNIKVIYLSPQGRKLDQKGVMELFLNKKIILVCGRYRGIDERLILKEIDEEWSIGDYVISGGELAAMVLIDSISRLIPGVLGHPNSIFEDSFIKGFLDYPNYTRPKIISNISVPEILLSGNHNKIQQWRLTQSIKRTWIKRPDILKNITLTDEQKKILKKIKIDFFYKQKKNKN